MQKSSSLTAYWRARAKGYQAEFSGHGLLKRLAFFRQERALRRVLRDEEFRTVQEIGCGFGRITRVMLNARPNIQRWEASDIAPAAIAAARKYVKDPRAVFRVGDASSLTPAGSDMAIAAEVLMHIPPSAVRGVLRSIVDASRHLVVNIDWYEPGAEPRGGYCFAHDYDALYEELGARSTRHTNIGKQAMWVVEV